MALSFLSLSLRSSSRSSLLLRERLQQIVSSSLLLPPSAHQPFLPPPPLTLPQPPASLAALLLPAGLLCAVLFLLPPALRPLPLLLLLPLALPSLRALLWPPSPHQRLLELQAQSLPLTSRLLAFALPLDLRLNRAIAAVREIDAFPLGPPSSASPPLHPLGLRKVISATLQQARHSYDLAALQLEALISSALPEQPSDDAPSSVNALMEMYACSRNPPPTLSLSQRARRQAWRAGLHARLNNPPSPASQPRPRSLQSNHSPALVPSSSPHTPLLAHTKSPSISTTSSSRRLSQLSTLHDSLYARALGINPPDHLSSHSLQSSSPMHHPSSSSPPLSSPSPHPPPRASPRLRPLSMSALSSHSPAHTPLSPSPHPINPPPPSPTIPHNHPNHQFTLTALQNSFVQMDLARRRLLCCLLSLPFNSDISTIGLWESSLGILNEIYNTVHSLSSDLNNGMSDTLGPGAFDDTPPAVHPPSHKPYYHDPDQIMPQTDSLNRYAPMPDQSHSNQQILASFKDQISSMDQILRSISAKMKVCVQDLELDCSQSNVTHALSVHESIRNDVDSYVQLWDQSRSKLRRLDSSHHQSAMGLSEKKKKKKKKKLYHHHQELGEQFNKRPWSLDSSGEAGGISSGRESSVLECEALLTPVDNQHTIHDLNSVDEAFHDFSHTTTLRAHTSLQERKERVKAIGLESIFERFAGQDFGRGRRAPARNSVSPTLSYQHSGPTFENQDPSAPLQPSDDLVSLGQLRDNQRRFDRRRVTINKIFTGPASMGEREKNSTLNRVTGDDYGGDGDPDVQGMDGVVTELKDVLNLLKSRKALES